MDTRSWFLLIMAAIVIAGFATFIITLEYANPNPGCQMKRFWRPYEGGFVEDYKLFCEEVK